MSVSRETNSIFPQYNVIVVGAGHAGCEASWAAGTMGSKVLLITMNMGNMGQMSCNPSMGGIAKGQIVREIDALGGLSGIVTDETMIQFRMLNRSKGPAMWSPRAQCDRYRFSDKWREMLESNENIDFLQDTVMEVMVERGVVKGVVTALGYRIYSNTVILTNGTFLNGIIHIGKKSFGGGRMGESAAIGLTANLSGLGFVSSRMKTGTPVRVDGRTIDFSQLEEQAGDAQPGRFSFMPTTSLKVQRSCYIAYTSLDVHNILRTGFDFSPMFSGRIKGIGPRYCPSIEDKIERFSDKDRHQLFVEPEGRSTIEYYINGFSSSLPDEVQVRALRQIKGFEKAKIFRPGYAIEYDFFPPTQLKHNLETRLVENLFFAGQINGTTGYEEAAAQGLMAGINAHLKMQGEPEFVLSRSDAYIGVLIDDLITKGVDEPYRMFTSRAEHRTLLRQDNADERLTLMGYNFGLASAKRLERYKRKSAGIVWLKEMLQSNSISPDRVDEYLASVGSSPLQQKQRIATLLLRPQVKLIDLLCFKPELEAGLNSLEDLKDEVIEEVEIQIKYEGYIQKEQFFVDRMNKYENLILKETLDYSSMPSLTIEARQKLNKIKPRTIGQASRISGISPADISALLIYVTR